MKAYQVSINEAIAALATNTATPFTVLLQHGSLQVEYFKPDTIDTQTPHKQDELYIVASGSGTFNRDGIRTAFSAGEVIFVPAGMEHRFENFTTDFATWVIFYGPQGGETA